MSAASDLSGILHRTFGHSEFRPHQQAVCEAAAAGRDVLLVMPTGAGKSLCYQLPALALGGTALVISPLIALMDDQAGKLEALGLRVARIHSGLSREDARKACRNYLDGALDFLFIAPERMRVPGFPEMLAKRKPALVAIDEAHCISQWGHDFRPDYRTLGQHLPALRPASIVALTATATPAVRSDVLAQLQLRDAAVFVTGFRRENLAVEVVELSKPQRQEFTAKLLKGKESRPAIVYAPSRKAAEELASELNRQFPAAAYHAGLQATVREKVQREFLTGKLDVVVATIAFGMGVDKANVRTVIHAALPSSVEGFYQEIGRAGRDGLPSRSVLLHSFQDRKMHEFFLERDYPPADELTRISMALSSDFEPSEQVLKRLRMSPEVFSKALEKLVGQGGAVMDMGGSVRAAGDAGAAWQKTYDRQVEFRRQQIDRMVAFAETNQCRMAALVRHFGDTTDRAGACGRCDVCRPEEARGSVSRQADSVERKAMRAILRAIEGLGRSTGKLFTDLALTKDRREFDGWVDALARAGLLTISGETFRTPDGRDVLYRKATITFEGREPDDRTMDTVLLRGDPGDGAKPKAKVRSREKAATVELNAEQRELAEALRAWRKRVAVELGRPSFFVLADTALVAIAMAQPRTLSELQRVNGIGPQKLEQFGADIVGLVRDGAGSGQAVERSPVPRVKSIPAQAVSVPGAPHVVVKPMAAGDLTTEQQRVEAEIRAWRRNEAAAAGLPSFFVLSDTVVRSIAMARPGSLEDLRGVWGVAPDKVEKFGAALVGLCRG